jgi:hypothetical protein
MTSREEFATLVRDLPELGRDDRDERFGEVQRFLERIGYLEPGSYAAGALDGASARALSRYQRFYGLERTGGLDAATRDLLTQPRCGLADPLDAAAFKTVCPWKKRTLTYAFDIGTPDIAGDRERDAVRAAFATWQAAINLNFVEGATNANPDIVIGWRPTKDPDSDMSGTVIAHSDYPPGCSTIVTTPPLPLHFDDGDLWTLDGAGNTLDVESVALHEIGHLIGLDHSTVGTVMYAYYTVGTTVHTLTQDDVDGGAALYGRRGRFYERTPLVSERQADEQLDVFGVSVRGEVVVSWVPGHEAWQGWTRLADSDFPDGFTVPAGSPLCAHQQGDDQLDLFAVGRDGAAYVNWVPGHEAWQGWTRIVA